MFSGEVGQFTDLESNSTMDYSRYYPFFLVISLFADTTRYNFPSNGIGGSSMHCSCDNSEEGMCVCVCVHVCMCARSNCYTQFFENDTERAITDVPQRVRNELEGTARELITAL